MGMAAPADPLGLLGVPGAAAGRRRHVLGIEGAGEGAPLEAFGAELVDARADQVVVLGLACLAGCEGGQAGVVGDHGRRLSAEM